MQINALFGIFGTKSEIKWIFPLKVPFNSFKLSILITNKYNLVI